MKFDVVFVAGVHGVGKGHLISSIKNKTYIWTLSASEIIKSEKRKEIDKGKVVIDADTNQDHLVTGLNNLNAKHKTLILDGHFCLQSDSSIYEVPLSTFESINIKTIFLVADDVDLIYKRLLTRDGVALDKKTIFNLQEAEKSRAKYIANQLNLSLITGTSSETSKILDVLNSC